MSHWPTWLYWYVVFMALLGQAVVIQLIRVIWSEVRS